jgi:DNA-binding NarL/FixJ family response regulator
MIRGSGSVGASSGERPGGERPGGERSSVSILVVDDQRIVRRAVRALLATAPGLEVIGEADGGEAAVRGVARLRPHVVLMDLMMPGIGGTEAIRRIVARGLQTRILVLTSFASAEDVGPALAAGASGWVSKDSEPAALVRAIRRACRHERGSPHPARRRCAADERGVRDRPAGAGAVRGG